MNQIYVKELLILTIRAVNTFLIQWESSKHMLLIVLCEGFVVVTAGC